MKFKLINLLCFLTTLAVFSLHCKNNQDTFEIVKLEINEHPPYSSVLVSPKFKLDSTIILQIVDANKNNSFVDQDTNSADYISVIDSKTNQFSYSIFKPTVRINYEKTAYSFSLDTINLTGTLSKSSTLFKDADINIFDTVPNIIIYNTLNLNDSIHLQKVVTESNNKYIFLCFWASYCTPCLEDLEYYNKNRNIVNRKGLTVVYISPISDYDRTLNIIKNKGYTGIYYVCSEQDMEKLNCQGFPNGILVNTNNEYIRHFGYSSTISIVKYLNL